MKSLFVVFSLQSFAAIHASHVGGVGDDDDVKCCCRMVYEQAADGAMNAGMCGAEDNKKYLAVEGATPEMPIHASTPGRGVIQKVFRWCCKPLAGHCHKDSFLKDMRNLGEMFFDRKESNKYKVPLDQIQLKDPKRGQKQYYDPVSCAAHTEDFDGAVTDTGSQGDVVGNMYYYDRSRFTPGNLPRELADDIDN